MRWRLLLKWLWTEACTELNFCSVCIRLNRSIARPRPAAEEEDEAWLGTVAVATRSALQQLGLQAKALGQTLTPNAAILRFAGSANVTVEQVLKRRSELLTTHGLSNISVRPEAEADNCAAIAARQPQPTVKSSRKGPQPPPVAAFTRFWRLSRGVHGGSGGIRTLEEL
ncbi:hypothetical protein [Polymorphobacter sp.]|uniref:hypothetical protein n=1 Tax=Polymorphobacter sp. TaxID=1909290 RepID=UPI003F713993